MSGYDVTDIVVSTDRDPDDPNHDLVNVRAGTLLAWKAVDWHFDDETAERLAPLAWHQGSLLARAALALQDELDLERLLHGCPRGTWYIGTRGTDPVRRAKSGDKVEDGEYATNLSAESCGTIHAPLDELFGVDMQLVVPRGRAKHYATRVREVLRDLAADVPQ